MIYHLLYPLSKYFFVFNLARYITFRSVCAFVLSFLFVMFLWNKTVKRLKTLKFHERIDMYGHIHLEALHRAKKGTPTSGGVLIIISVVLTTLVCARWDNHFIWYVLLVMVSLGVLGLWDDWRKIKKGKGFGRGTKLLFQGIIGFAIGIIAYYDTSISTAIDIPFFKRVVLDLGYFYIFWAALVIVASSNAVNLTDGLDGLAIGSVVINCLVFVILSYIVGHSKFAEYLFIPYVKDVGELSIFCTALIGAGLGFLWFNSYPAQIFMGDVGALALGGVIGAVALFVKKELLLLLSGGIFVIEGMTVLLQIVSVRVRGKRIFKAAPLHHHLQLKGWPESKIVIRLWIIAIMCAAMSLITLKLR